MKAKVNNYSIADFITSGRKVKNQFFKQINSLIDWEKLRPIIERAYTKDSKGMGRQCHDSLVLFRIELLRTWYGLSDGEVEDQVNDRLSFSRFAGINLDENCPDSTNICRFRSALIKGGVYDALLNEINHQLEKVGLIVKRGEIVNPSITDTSLKGEEKT